MSRSESSDHYKSAVSTIKKVFKDKKLDSKPKFYALLVAECLRDPEGGGQAYQRELHQLLRR
jgi:hypothetical protein